MQSAHILLAEDDDVLGDLIMRNLQARGHDVKMTGDAENALALLRSSEFDLVLLDINLPDRTGWDILREAQQEGILHPLDFNEHEQVLPVVVLSAVRVSPHRLAEFHPLAYLPKPFPMEALLRLVAEVTARNQHVPGRPSPGRPQESPLQ